MDITFNCGKCGQAITIDEAGAGQLVDCPKCGKPMEVPYKSEAAVPQAPTASPQPEPPKALARKIQGYSLTVGGRESSLESFGNAMLALCIIGAIGFLVASIVNENGVFFVAAVACVIQGIFFYVVFHASAEGIRLLKKIAGLPFAGEISKPDEILRCSKCHSQVYSFQHVCSKCGAEFQDVRQ